MNGLNMGDLERRLHQARQSAMQAELTSAGLQEVGHPMLLCILDSAGACCPSGQVQAQRELAQHLHISPAAVATSLKSLEKRGYIHRQPAEGDSRRNRVRLTEKGRAAVEGCAGCFQRVNQRLYAGFQPRELEELEGFYRRMLDNLEPPEE